MYRITILNGQANRHVTSFMNGCRVTFLFIHHEALAFSAHQDSIASVFNMLASHRF